MIVIEIMIKKLSHFPWKKLDKSDKLYLKGLDGMQCMVWCSMLGCSCRVIWLHVRKSLLPRS